MRTAFARSGGRLFRIALIFFMISIMTIAVMSFFTYRAMDDMKELALQDGGIDLEIQMFYVRVIDNMKLGTVLGSLSGVLIAIAARYGLRETSRNIGEGLANRGGRNEAVAQTVDSGGDTSAGTGGH